VLFQNLSEGGLVNGSIGKCIGFKSAAQAQGPEHDADDPEISIAQASDTKHKDEWHGNTASTKSGKNKEQIPQGIWPVVEFTNGSTMLLPPMEFIIENAGEYHLALHRQVAEKPLIDGKVECQRTQGKVYTMLVRCDAY